jgi:flavin-binding protein dodecin
MAQDRPTASELLAAIAELLREEVTPVLDKADPRLGFQMRVAANSLAILEREARLGPAADAREHERLVTLLGRDGSLDDLNRELARQLRRGAYRPSRSDHRRQDRDRQSEVAVTRTRRSKAPSGTLPAREIPRASRTLPLTRPGKVVSFRRRHAKEKRMTSRTYVKSEVVGSSDKSVSDAIESAIATASRSLRNLEWFEVVDVRGSIRDNKVANYQVTLKLGLRYEPKA